MLLKLNISKKVNYLHVL